MREQGKRAEKFFKGLKEKQRNVRKWCRRERGRKGAGKDERKKGERDEEGRKEKKNKQKELRKFL